ncbi:hypothetical protein ZOSMA_110G00210 [Zostera marina]|uniref:DUF4218 domain-containing protein n=1 Tax=Zostera marina TaxID=29655 RepID=A0A0K9Q5J1_ZOSMR|nr:hypothetical protein ZOSMA_110G00210 [Zostera marina]
MIHLVVHLASETKLSSPVHYRWMYPIERYLLILKKYVRARSHPEGSIAEKHLVDESMTFCSRFLHNVETKSNKTKRYIDGYYSASTHTSLTKLEHGQVHRYIIFNLDNTEIFQSLHIDNLKQWYVRGDTRMFLVLFSGRSTDETCLITSVTPSNALQQGLGFRRFMLDPRKAPTVRNTFIVKSPS